MIDCAMLEARTASYLAGDMSLADAEAVEAHAAECDHCGVLLEERTRLPQALPRELLPPQHVRAATLRRVRRAIRHRSRRRIAVQAAVAASLVLIWGVTRPADKAARMRAREWQSPMAMAESRAFPEFEALRHARSEVDLALAEGNAADRTRLEAERDRLARHYDRLVTLVQEFER